MKVLITDNEKTGKGKGRRFAATVLAFIEADNTWSGGESVATGYGNHDSGKPHRPVFLMVTGSSESLRPFLANMQLGRHAIMQSVRNGAIQYSQEDDSVSARYELLRSTGMKRIDQTLIPDAPGQIISTIFHPDLFKMEPGIVDDHQWINFICLLPQVKAYEILNATIPSEQQKIVDYLQKANLLFDDNALGIPSLPLNSEEIMMWLAESVYFASFLEKRVYEPFPPYRAFMLHLLLCALKAGVASLSKDYVDSAHMSWAKHQQGFITHGIADIKCLPPISASYSPARIRGFLLDSVKSYHAIMGGM